MNSFWQDCLRLFRTELPQAQFDSWIKPLSCSIGADTIDIIAPNRLAMRWFSDHYLDRVSTLARERAGRDYKTSIRLGVRPDAQTDDSTPTPAAPVTESAATAEDERQRLSRLPPGERTRINPAYTFESFVTGKANQLARAAAMQVAESPGAAYNPLFIYGGVGLGKTHLLQAIGNKVLARTPGSRVRYLHAADYVSDLVQAVHRRTFEEFKRYYQSIDLLLIDDIQFFAGKDRTQEEFFYTFNALLETRRQVVITCDTFPKEISGVEDRLKTRFGWGLTVAIEPPDLEMRVAILLRKAEEERLVIDETTAFFVAQQIHSNVRELEGALKRLSAYSRFHGAAVDVDLAREALKDLIAVHTRSLSVENIQRTVADYYKIKVSEMYSKKRTRNIARPRQMAMALAKELTPLSLPDIGEAFGGRDHTTVLHACRKIAELKSLDAGVTRDFDSLIKVLRN
jgi:chromosomal replication initiator protein